MTDPLLDRLFSIDIDRFTVDDVAFVVGTWRWVAKLILRTAVRRGECERIGDSEFYRVTD